MSEEQLQHNSDWAVEFLRKFHGICPVVLTSIVPDGVTTTDTFMNNPAENKRMRAWIEARQGQENIYHGVNPPIMAPLKKKATKEDIGWVRWLHCDVDPRVGEDFGEERVRILKLLSGYEPAATLIVDSGGGYQLFYKLQEDQEVKEDPDAVALMESYNRQLELELGGDHVFDISRIMRVPYTVNIPNKKKLSKGRKKSVGSVVVANWEKVYPLTSFVAAPKLQEKSAAPGRARRVSVSGNLPKLYSLDELPEAVSPRLKMIIVQGHDPDEPHKWPSRSECLFYVVCALVRAGLDDDTIAAILLDKDYGISASVLESGRPELYAARQIERARESAIDPMLTQMNDEHAVIMDVGGKCRVVTERFDEALMRHYISYQDFDNFKNGYRHQKVVVGEDKHGNNITMDAGTWWTQHPMRRTFATLGFIPGKEVTNCYNLWRGFSCEARPGDCSLYLQHIKENICSGNEEHYNYIIKWMARCVQVPATQGEVAIVLRGRMGTGKGVFASEFGKLWGRHYMQISDAKHLVGSFNAHLRDCILLFADEAFYAGDKRHESNLKTLITEETRPIEAKGVDVVSAPNYTRLIMASNNLWVVPAGVDERRFFVLDVDDARMQQHAYFAKIKEQMKQGGREALLHMLLKMDLTGFEVRKAPHSEALQEQKELSRPIEELWWYEKLWDGRLLSEHLAWEQKIERQVLLWDYADFCRQQNAPMRRVTTTFLASFLTRALPANGLRQKQEWGPQSMRTFDGKVTVRNNGRPIMWHLPPLAECRASWDKNLGGRGTWPEEEAPAEQGAPPPAPRTPF
jgi:hypothetical protein